MQVSSSGVSNGQVLDWEPEKKASFDHHTLTSGVAYETRSDLQ